MRRMVLVAVLTAGCALHRPPEVGGSVETAGILRLFAHNSIAQGCPVAPQQLLTARHVAAPGGMVGQTERTYVIWSDLDGHTGSAWTKDYDFRRDVALMESDRAFDTVYPVAKEPPAVGDNVTIAGYDFTRALIQKVVRVAVLNVVSSHLVLSKGGEQGFSGSCVLNGNSEVVGIYHWGMGLDEMGQAIYGVASIVTGDWRNIGWTPPGLSPLATP
jgi:V8-like Glu-specific endopeptidase